MVPAWSATRSRPFGGAETEVELQRIPWKIADQRPQTLARTGIEHEAEQHQVVADIGELALLDQATDVGIAHRRFDLIEDPALALQLLANVVGAQCVEQCLGAA